MACVCVLPVNCILLIGCLLKDGNALVHPLLTSRVLKSLILLVRIQQLLYLLKWVWGWTAGRGRGRICWQAFGRVRVRQLQEP